MATNSNATSPYPTTVMVGLHGGSTQMLDRTLNFIESTKDHDDHAASHSNMTNSCEVTVCLILPYPCHIKNVPECEMSTG